MKKINRIIRVLCSLFVFFSICIFISGCCGHSSGGSSFTPANTTTIGQVTVKADDPVSFVSDGISLNALPNTFADGTTIKFTKVTSGNLLSCLGMSGKDITLDSDVYGIEINPQQELLNNAATLTLDLTSTFDNTKKYYFSVNRETPTLVTSENPSRSLNYRAATVKKFELGFITTFNYVALAHLNKEVLAKDPTVWCDNSSKEVVNNKYTSNVTIFSQVSTKDKINEIINGTKATFKLAFRTDSSNLPKLSHKDTPLATRKSQAKSNLTYGYIDLATVQSNLIDEYTMQYDAFLDSTNKTYQDIPRRVVIEGVFTNNDNIPISSQEYVVYFRSSKRPYVISTYPADKDIITNIAQIENIVVNFSEPMDTDSVEQAISITTQKKTYTGQNKDNKLTFNWDENNKKLAISGNYSLGTATGTFDVKIAKSACSALGANISKDAYSKDSSDIKWSFNFVKKDFYVLLTSPKPGDTNVDIKSQISNTEGPDITLTFSESIHPKGDDLESAISLKSSDGKYIKFKGSITGIDEKQYIITPKNKLSYNTEYIVEVLGSILNFNQNKSLDETYRASFRTKEPFSSGTGTKNDPYLITNQDELDNIRTPGYINTEKYFKLANDITYQKSLTIGTNYNAYWVPIGDDDTPFSGHFDGNNKSIIDLDVNQNDPNVGLFGKVVNSTISNLNIKNPDIDGHEYVGSVVGYAVSSTISNIKVTDIDINATSERAGGLVGVANASQIDNCSVESKDNLFGTTDYCGGLVGVLTAKSTINNSYAKLTNNAELGGSDLIGGLVGYSENSKIQNSDFYGIIRASTNDVGGIVGKASNSEIIRCRSKEGAASGSTDIGGICGELTSNSVIDQCVSQISVTGAENNVGGLVGNLDNSTVTNSYVGDVVIKSSADCSGGLIGYMKDSLLDYTFSRSSVSGKDSVGGLVGLGEGSVTIRNSAALNIELAGSNKDNLNKVLGKGNPTITNCYSLSKMIISFVGTQADTESYQHAHNKLDGTEKSKIKDIVKNLLLDTSIWNTTNEYPSLTMEQ